MVSLDSPFAAQSGLGRMQALAGDNRQWSVQSESEASQGVAQLVPKHGDFLALYATIDNFASVDKTFSNPDGSKTVYGAFTFDFAQALQDQSCPRRGRSPCASSRRNARARDVVYRREGSNPAMPLFDGAARSMRMPMRSF